ncbi:MAG: amidase [Verrucomicrobiota bacterium]|jgi:Asp-tRNA(Asn)/Glu-tRNA(Gln) amidotransferase A subunit family amidase
MKQPGIAGFKWLPMALASLVLCGGCSAVPGFTKKLPGNRAFIDYWAPDPNSNQLRVAVKDNIDIKGVVTTAGSEIFFKTHKPAEKDAPCLAIARRRQVQIVGKTNMTEFAISPSGLNQYFGTAVNPLNRNLIPGGSSSGNGVALASGMADVAFGTDTAGSNRVPAACCGIVGLKTTYGLIPIEGVYPVEPEHLDTVGPMGKDIARTVQGMELLQDGFAAKYASAKAAKPTARSIRIGRLKLKGTDQKIDQAIDDALVKTGFEIMELDESLSDAFEQAKKDGTTVAAAGAWISDKRFRYALGVASRTKSVIRLGQIDYNTGYRSALARRSAWQRTLRKVFEKVDLIALPTLQKAPPGLPLIDLRLGILEAQLLSLQNTVAVNFAGNPALAVPVPLRGSRVPVTSLQLIGPRLAEADLLNAGRLVESAVKR